MRTWDKSKPPRGPWTLNKDSPRAQGLVGWWPMGGASGGLYLPDYSESNAHMTLASGKFSLGDVGQPCITLNGTSDVASTATGTGLISGAVAPFAMTTWFKANSASTAERIFTVSSTSSSNPFNLLQLNSSGKAEYQNRNDAATNSASYTSSASVVVGAWNFLGASVQSIVAGTGNVYLVFNNETVTNTSNSWAGAQTLNKVAIGAFYFGSTSPGNFFGGDIGECCLYNVGKTSAELRAYSDPGKRFELWYPLRSKKWLVFIPTAITYESSGNSGDIAAASSYSGAASWANTNRMLAVNVSMLGPGVNVTAMTYGGATCTLIGTKSTVTSLGGVECWRIVSADSGAPAAGSNTLSITLSGSIEFTVEWSAYSTVNQVVPVEALNTAQATNAGSATDASVVVTTKADNCWVQGAIVANDTSITANQTSRNNISGTLGSGGNEDNNTAKTPAGAVTMSYTGLGITTTWAMVGYAIRPLAAASTATLTCPSTGITGSPSSNCTITLDQPATATYNFTPAGTVGSITFSPTNPQITAGNSSVTFTINAASNGAHVISITNDGGLTNIGTPTYTSSGVSGSNANPLYGAFNPTRGYIL